MTKTLLTLFFSISLSILSAQMRVKTESGQTIELKSDGTWTVVSEGSAPTTNTSKKSTTKSEEPTTQNPSVNTLDCSSMNFGKITFSNQLSNPVVVRFYNAVLISLNYEYGIEGTQYSQYRYFYSNPQEQVLTIRPKSSSTIFNVRSGNYQYFIGEELQANDFSSNQYRAEGNIQISNCSEEVYTIKK